MRGCRSQAPSSPPSALNDLRWGVYEMLGLQGQRSRDGELRTASCSLHKPVHSEDGPSHLHGVLFAVIRIQFRPDVTEGRSCVFSQADRWEGGVFFFFFFMGSTWTGQ